MGVMDRHFVGMDPPEWADMLVVGAVSRRGLTHLLSMASFQLVSFPDPAFTKDKCLVHFSRNLGLPDLAGKE